MDEPFDAKALAEEILDPFTLEWEEAAAVRDAIAAALSRVREETIDLCAKRAEYGDTETGMGTHLGYNPKSMWGRARRSAADDIRALAQPKQGGTRHE